ncbi:FxSxx-COOH system tetratricopeptide repeat protein [Streptomyces sp. NPDC057690]|uniref:FxSxx-COOH system tetratricopeptide repeat protein n=1 Tax=Streptomyces sp. NPDC057690 TaxID=3346214 RepID=UPI0036A5B345
MDGIPRERAPGPEDDPPHWHELADAIWLAAHWSRGGRTVPTELEVPADDEPDWMPSLPEPTSSAYQGPTGAESVAVELNLPAPGPAIPAGAGAGPFLVPGTRPRGRGRAAQSAVLARALHRLARRVPSRQALLLDEELTAERTVVDGLWLPFFRPAETPAFDLVVLVDNGPTMDIWRSETAALVDAAEHSGAFRAVRTVRVNVPHDGAHEPTLRWSATARSTAALGEILDGRGDRLFLVVTDGLGHGWAAHAADTLLHRLGRAGPTALVHLLPPHLRHRSSLRPRGLTLEAGGFGAGNRGLGFGPPLSGPDPLRPHPDATDEHLAIPVLSLKPGSLAAWADLVVGERGVRRELPAVLAGSLNAGTPAPGLRAPQWPRTADTAVRRFFELATPAARRLATQIAAVPFEFDLIEQLRDWTMPESGAEHLAEILMGGLIDWEHADAHHPEFADGVREALLATTTRTQLANVVHVVADLPASGEHGRALRAALSDPVAIPLPDPSAGGWWRSELAVMRALAGPGPFSRRARRLEAIGVSRLPETVPGFSDMSATSAMSAMTDAAAEGIPGPLTGADLRPAPVSQAPSMATATLESQPNGEAERSPQPALMVNVPPRNGSFVGRTAQLRSLEEGLAAQDVVCVLPHALHSSSGVGTSELALEYVYRNADRYDLVCWLPAESESLLLASLAGLAGPLGVGPAGHAAHAVDWAVPAVVDALRVGAPYDSWLLVLDSAENVDVVRRHLPQGPGKIIVTSTNRAWTQVAGCLELDVFEREESVALLGQLWPALPTDEADRLARELCDVPLAVEQAGSWHQVTGGRTDDYLELFRIREGSVGELARSAGPPVPLTLAWEIALELLRETNPRARRLLDLCASLAPEPIPLTLLSQAPTADGTTPESEMLLGDPAELYSGLRDLSRLRLVRVDHRAGTLRLHRLLRATLLAALTTDRRERMREAAHRLLAAGRPGSPPTPQEWSDYWSLLPHVIASRAVTSLDEGVRALVHDTVVFLDDCGDREGAVVLCGETREAWLSASGEENIEVLRMTNIYASLLCRAGRVPQAVPLAEKSLEVLRRIAEQTDELIDSLCRLADARRRQGRLREARELSEEAAEAARSALGAEDPFTLRAVKSLALDLRLGGRYAEALAWDRQNARLGEELFGPVDQFTLESLDALSVDMREAGDYPGAREAQEDLYRAASSALGERHRLTLSIAANLAVCRRRDGALAEAAALSEDTLWHRTACSGADHLDTLFAAVNAAVDRRLIGDVQLSRQLGETTAQRLTDCLGPDHLCTLVAEANRAATLRTLGDLEEAQRLERDVAHRLEGTVGPRHPAALTVALGRANTAYVALDFDRAHEIDEANLSLLTEIAGERHPLRLACAANLALDLLGLGRGAEADVLQRTAVDGFTAAVRAGHPWLVSARQRRRIECDLAYVPL